MNTRVQVSGLQRINRNVGRYEVSRCCTRAESEESIAHRPQSTQTRGSTFALKPSADITRSPKQGYQSPSKRTDVFQTICKRKQSSFTREDQFICISIDFGFNRQK